MILSNVGVRKVIPRTFLHLLVLLGITPAIGLAVEQGSGDSFKLVPCLWAAHYVGTSGHGDSGSLKGDVYLTGPFIGADCNLPV